MVLILSLVPDGFEWVLRYSICIPIASMGTDSALDTCVGYMHALILMLALFSRLRLQKQGTCASLLCSYAPTGLWSPVGRATTRPGGLWAGGQFSSCFKSLVLSISVVVDVLSVSHHLPFNPWWRCPPAGDDLVAAASDLVHPHGIKDVEGDAGGDPGDLSAKAQAVVLGGAEGGKNTGPVRWHDGDTHQEEDHRHGHTVHHH